MNKELTSYKNIVLGLALVTFGSTSMIMKAFKNRYELVAVNENLNVSISIMEELIETSWAATTTSASSTTTATSSAFAPPPPFTFYEMCSVVNTTAVEISSQQHSNYFQQRTENGLSGCDALYIPLDGNPKMTPNMTLSEMFHSVRS